MKLTALVILFVMALAGCSGAHSDNQYKTRTAGYMSAQASPAASISIDGYRADYEVRVVDGSMVVTDRKTTQAVYYGDIRQIEFVDRVTIFGADGPEAAVYRLYQATFGRQPDPQGLGFWIRAVRNGTSLEQIAQGFMQSGEFQLAYGGGDTRSFLTRVYTNVLRRAPDAGGLDWWLETFNSGNTRLATLLAFCESSENKQNVLLEIASGFDFAPYRTLADHTTVALTTFTSPPVGTHTQVVVGIDQLDADLFVLTSAYWDFDLVGADRFRAGPQYLLRWNGRVFEDVSGLVDGGMPVMYAAEIAGGVADVNHDGIRDVVLGGNGPDGEGVKAEPSYLILSKTGGFSRVLVPNAALDPGAYSFAHGLTTIQRRGHTNRSVFIGDFAYGPSSVSDLDTNSRLSLAADVLPAYLGKQTSLSWAGAAADTSVTAALGADLDGDGAEELIVGTQYNWVAAHTYPALNALHTMIVRQDSNGSFEHAQPIALPNGPFPKNDCYQKIGCASLTVKKIAAADFNGDGTTDLIIDHHVYGSNAAGASYTGSYPQLLINKGGLQFEDATSNYFGKNMIDEEGGNVHSHPFDLNGDGCPDLVLRGDANNLEQPRVFLNDCAGKMIEFTADFLKLIPKINGVHEQMYGGVPIILGGKPTILLWSGTGTYDSNLHAVQFSSKIPTPTGDKVTY